MTETNVESMITECEQEHAAAYIRIEQTARFNQKKVLNAFRNHSVALRHFSGSSGYGYEDEGKNVLSAVFAEAFGAENAIVSPLIASGTHAIAATLFGLLRPRDILFCVSGTPYDTLVPVITGKGNGSLADFGISYHQSDLTSDGALNIPAIIQGLQKKPRVVWIQRSRGYTWRDSFSVANIGELVSLVKKHSPDSVVAVDNCYGEFTEKVEPTAVGADVIVGSLIKNPGGGIAPTGGYIAGKRDLICQIANRLTAPGIGTEVGSYTDGYRSYFQGFFLAPHITAQALKGALLFRNVFTKLGYDTLPKHASETSDIICSIRFRQKEELIEFCQAIQFSAPVDSFAVPTPWDMPGYENQVIMASGSFVQGSSIELSADAPIREPYIAFVQGGLTYEHIRIAVAECVLRTQN